MNARPWAECSFALPAHSSESGLIRSESGYIRLRELRISLPFMKSVFQYLLSRST